MQLPWSSFKQFVNEKNALSNNVSIQFVDINNTYWMKAFDGPFEVSCILPKDDGEDQIDFETNYKSVSNRTISTQVTTDFEKRDKTLKIAHGQQSVSTEDGSATILIKIPGIPGSGDGRWISCGVAFFSTHNAGDKILSVRFTDEDNLLGMGAGSIVGSYTDDDADSGNQGWAIPPNGWVKAEAIGGYGFAPSGLYIKVQGQKAEGNYTGDLFINFEWGKSDG